MVGVHAPLSGMRVSEALQTHRGVKTNYLESANLQRFTPRPSRRTEDDDGDDEDEGRWLVSTLALIIMRERPGRVSSAGESSSYWLNPQSRRSICLLPATADQTWWSSE
eukprot:COSAG05_NODE_112_length_18489_cov_15.556281_18_plen_109_part_00